MILNIPTILTLFRIAAIPVIVVIFYLPFDEARLWCTVLFIVASITDWLDGFLARKLNLQTPFGEFLDPVADKLSVVIVLVLIVQGDPSVYIAIPAAIIIGREVMVASLREWMAGLGSSKKIKVSWLGKLKTSFQMLSIICLLYNQDVFLLPVREIGIALIYFASALTLWSMWQYILIALPEFKNNQ